MCHGFRRVPDVGPLGRQQLTPLHQLFPCTNFACDRLTTATWCCAPCEQAEAGRYEIHEDGPLGHTDTCDQRHQERGPSTEYQRVMHRASRRARPPAP